jgi:hypothetical protein
MAVGRSAPRHQMTALLYPQSKTLQAYLSEYFTVVVHLCHQILKFAQMSPLGQFATTLNDSDRRTFQSELDTWANLIGKEVNVMMASKIEQEAQENLRFRASKASFLNLYRSRRR